MNESLVRCPFIVAIDTQEGAPWPFTGITVTAGRHEAELLVETRYLSLGRHPNSRGDYSILGLEDEVGIERKSIADAQSTVLGWQTKSEKDRQLAGHRDRFKQELKNLSAMPCCAVIVEGELGEVLDTMPQWGERTAEQNRMYFNRSLLSWGMRYRVPWYFMRSRHMAEVEAFRLMDMYWRRLPKKRRVEIVTNYELDYAG